MPLEDFPSGAYAGTDHGVSLAASIQEHFGTSRDGRRAALQHRPLRSPLRRACGFHRSVFRSRRWAERAFFDTGGVAHRHATVERL